MRSAISSLALFGACLLGCAGAPLQDRAGADPGVIRTGERQHVVRPGETFYSIARQYQITVDQLRRANSTAPPENLPIGIALRIPPAKPEVRRVESTGQR